MELIVVCRLEKFEKEEGSPDGNGSKKEVQSIELQGEVLSIALLVVIRMDFIFHLNGIKRKTERFISSALTVTAVSV